jgi:CDP-glycerol glycerophosphotransferase (TagB/SpsB family)
VFIPIFRVVDFCIPKSGMNILFFGHGGRFIGNAKYFYKYMLENKNSSLGKWLPSWIVTDIRDSPTIANLNGTEVCLISYWDKLKFTYKLMQTKALVITSLGDLYNYRLLVNKYCRVTIHVSNGITIKSNGVNVPFLTKKTLGKWFKKAGMVTYHTVSSELERYFLSATLLSDPRKFIITGEQRDDQFVLQSLAQNQIRKELSELLGIKNKGGNKYILYAPSHRDVSLYGKGGNTTPKYFPFDDLNVESMVNTAEQNDWHYLIRAHMQDDNFSQEEYLGINQLMLSNNFHYLPNTTVPDVNDFAVAIDLILTDYSGIYLDFLLLGKPVVFIPYDIDHYREYRGLMFEYGLFTPGPKIYTQVELIEESKKIFQDISYYHAERESVKNAFFLYEDDKACERTVQLIERPPEAS